MSMLLKIFFVFKASIIVELIIPYPLAKVISSTFVCIEKREIGKLEESQDEVNTQSILVQSVKGWGCCRWELQRCSAL